MWGRSLLRISIVLLLILSARLVQAEYEELTGSYTVHDPCIIKHGAYYYVFSTGIGIEIRRSTDLHNWVFVGRVFSTLPQWVVDEVEGVSNLWAPDISYRNGRYYLYYSASTFGSNTSRIGLASNLTLDPSDPNYQWVDEGKVIGSESSNNYNTIDGNVIQAADGQWWLNFGSFWDGIKLTRLDATTGKPTTTPPSLYSLAKRPSVSGNPIEAPFIVYRDGYYYLFVSFDYCCRGVNSTYRVMFGRSQNITGPYIDKNGVKMTSGGGTQITWPDVRWKGPGHNAVLLDDNGRDWLVHHAYDAEHSGRSYMRIHQLYWTPNGWPTLTEPNCADVHNLGYGFVADWTHDCYVDFYDFTFLADAWLDDFDWCDIDDLASQWLNCNNPQDPNCTDNW